MKRECASCKGCLPIDTIAGSHIYICIDESGGAFLQEVGPCGWCESEEEEE